MPIYGQPGISVNAGMYASPNYDYSQVMAFINAMNDQLAPQGRNGGDTDPLHSAATMGMNSLDVRFVPGFCDVPAVTSLQATLENEHGDQDEIVVPMSSGSPDDVVPRTTAWITAFHDAVMASLRRLAMPIRVSIPPSVYTPIPVVLTIPAPAPYGPIV